jgi:hypothetical protein
VVENKAEIVGDGCPDPDAAVTSGEQGQHRSPVKLAPRKGRAASHRLGEGPQPLKGARRQPNVGPS